MQNFVMLISLASTPDSGLVAHIERACTAPPKFLWADKTEKSAFAVQSEKTAMQLWRHMTNARLTGVKEVMVLALGNDWCCRGDSPAVGYLTRALGEPAGFAPN